MLFGRRKCVIVWWLKVIALMTIILLTVATLSSCQLADPLTKLEDDKEVERSNIEGRSKWVNERDELASREGHQEDGGMRGGGVPHPFTGQEEEGTLETTGQHPIESAEEEESFRNRYSLDSPGLLDEGGGSLALPDPSSPHEGRGGGDGELPREQRRSSIPNTRSQQGVVAKSGGGGEEQEGETAQEEEEEEGEEAPPPLTHHPCVWCAPRRWLIAPATLATAALLLLLAATTATMYNAIRSYKKETKHKHESSRSSAQNGSASHYVTTGNGHGGHHQSAIGGGSSSMMRESSQHHEGNGYGNGSAYGSMHRELNREGGHLVETRGGSTSHLVERGAGQGFSESSTYETREHFERKVQRVKKTRSERERERSRSLRRGDGELDALEGGSAKDALLAWAQRATEGYPRVRVSNFTNSWRDGLAFNAILHRYRPKAIDWEQISDPSVSNRERLANAFEVAKREFDVDKLLDPEDVDRDTPDEKSIITYVSSLYQNLPNLPEASKGSLADLTSRLTRAIGIINEKLDLILIRIEDVESRVDSASPAEIERIVNGIVDDLNALESPIAICFEDVEQLKQHRHPDANDFYRQVLGLHQRRNAYLDRLNNQLLVRLGVRTETMRRQQMEQSESARRSRFGRVEECIQWVRTRMEHLVNMEFSQALEKLEEMFSKHKLDNHEIQDFRQEVDMCIARQSEITAEDSVEYCELLSVLESEYQQLRDLSAGRMLDLDSLIAFVRAAQMELVWVSEREEIEVHRNWSDINQLDLPMLSNYYKQLLHEMELREPQYNEVHNRGAALLNQGHPAIQVIEVYIQTLKKQWDWLLNLSRCLEEHLRDANNLKSFMEEAAEVEVKIREYTEILERNYNKTDFSLDEGERMLQELDNLKEHLNGIQSVIHKLSERCATISPLWQRGERISKNMLVTALCDYEDAHVNIRAGDDVILLDNGDLVHWKIQDVMGKQGIVPSVVFRIPPPDTRLTAWLTRLLQQFEKLRKLWDLKHRMIRFYMVLNTMKTIQGWDVNMFNSLDPDQRDAIIRALQDDTNKLLSELDPNDPLAQRLRDELKKTMDHFWSLFNQAQRQPEEDLSNEFDRMMADLLRKLEDAWRALKERTGRPVPRTAEELERALKEQREFEDMLQSLDGDVNNLKAIFSQMTNPSPSQRHNMDRVNVLWDDSWDLSKMYVERMKVLDMVLAGIIEVKDIVRAHEVTLNSFDDLPCALDKLRGEHAQLVELNMVLKQQQTLFDQLNHNVSLLRQHVARTRLDTSTHPDVDRLEEEVQHLNNRWENVQTQLTERLRITELALQIQMVYRGEYENEMAWLDRVEDTINKLRKPEELRPEQYQQQLDLLVAEYAQLQERTAAIENVNREGGKYIREAKGYDGRLKQYGDAIRGIHGRDIEREFKRTHPQPKNGAQIVTEELEALNRRFAQLSSLILEKRNVMQVLIQNWKREKQEEEDRRKAEEEAKRRAFEAARLKALEDADRLRREREEAEAKRKRDAEADRLRRLREQEDEDRRRREEDDRRRKEDEDRRRREAEERERRRLEDEARRRREDEDRRRREEEDRRRREEEERQRKPMPNINVGNLVTHVTGEEDADDFDELLDLPDRAKVTEHEDEMQMFQETTEIKTQFYEMEGTLHKQTGEILTFVEALREGLLDLHSGGGAYFDLVTGNRISLEEASKRGLISEDFSALLNKHHGLHHPETRQSLSLLEAIQIGLYDPDTRQLKDIDSGKVLSFDSADRAGILTYNSWLNLIKTKILKAPPMSLEKALEKSINPETGEFTAQFSQERLALKDAIFHEYVEIADSSFQPELKMCLSDVIRDDFVNGASGDFEDANSADKFSLRDALGKKVGIISMGVREVVNTSTEPNKKIRLGDAIVANAINQRDQRFTDLKTRKTLSLKEAWKEDLIAKPMTLLEAHEKQALIPAGDIITVVDRGTKQRLTLLQAIAAGILDADARHIVDPEEQDVVSIAVALERGLLTAQGLIRLEKAQKEYKVGTDAVHEGLLTRRARHTIFDVKGIKNSASGEQLSVNEAIEQGALNVQAERVTDLGTSSSYALSDTMAAKRVMDETLLQHLTAPVGIKDDRGGYDGSLIKAVRRGLIDPAKGCFVHDKREMTVREAYRAKLITLRGAIAVGGLFDVHPSLVAPSKRVDKRKRISRPGGPDASQMDDQVKVTLEEAMKQGLIDSRTQRFRQGDTDVPLDVAIERGLIDPTKEWVTPSKAGGAAGPTIEEKTSESITETGQQLAPKYYPDRNLEESITTVKRVRTTETTALGGPGGVSVYRAIAGGKGSLEAPSDGFHIYVAERNELIDLTTGQIRVPNVDRVVSFAEGIELGVIDAKTISVRDPSTGRTLGVKEALEKGVMDSNGRVGGQSIERAIDARAIIIGPEPDGDAGGGSENKKVIHFTAGSDQVISFRPVGQPVIEEHEQEWSFDAAKGLFVDRASGEQMNLERALATGRLTTDDLMVTDAHTGKPMSFAEAERWGIIDARNRYYVDKRDNQRMSFSEAARNHRIYPTGGVAENAGDAVHTSVKTHTRTFVTKKEALGQGGQPLTGGGHTLGSSIAAGIFDAATGRFALPGSEKPLTLKEALIKTHFNPYDTTVIDRRSGKELSLLEAIQEGIVDDTRGTVRDTQTGVEHDLAAAAAAGLIKTRSVMDQLALRNSQTSSVPAIGARPTSSGGGGQQQHHSSSRIVEQRLELTPFAPAPQSHNGGGSSSQVVFRGAGGPTSTGRRTEDGRHEIVDIGGGKQAQFKVVRGEGGKEMGEYVDPTTGMKYTINVGGDPYVTETKTTVKSTQQVQSVELEPHAEFVGIDKIRDKRTGRTMSLEDAKRLGLAKVDRKGKQQTKTYSAFRSNIQNAVLKGVIDANGEKISLEEAIRQRIVNVERLTYVNTKTGETISLAQAANMGLVDVTLSEILPQGVINPANQERIPISRAIQMGIVDPHMGTVQNPHNKERLDWLDLLRPIFNAITSEGVYDPTKGYGVPVVSAINDGLIAHGRYHNPITGEYVELEEAAARGLIDRETLRTITKPFLADPQSPGKELNLIQAVERKLVDPKNKTIQLSRNSTVSISKAIVDGKIPSDIGDKLRRHEKITVPEAIGKGALNLVNNTFADPDSGRQMTVEQAVSEGYLDAGSAGAQEGDEKNLAHIVESDEYDERSGRVRDRKTGLNLTFKQAVERDVIDGDSLLHDLDSGATLTIRDALRKAMIDQDGQYVEPKSGVKMGLRSANDVGLIALIGSPMQAAQAVTEAVKRREKEGYKFKIESAPHEDSYSASQRQSLPRMREEQTTYKFSSPHHQPGLSVRMRSSERSSGGAPVDRIRSMIEDPVALADKQQDFIAALEANRFDVDERILQSPVDYDRKTMREATETGLFDVLTGEIVHSQSGARYSIPKAVGMKWLGAEQGRRILETLGASPEDIAAAGLDRPGSRTSATFSSSSGRPGSGVGGGGYSSTTTTTTREYSAGGPATSSMSPSESANRQWTKTVSWSGKPDELRRSGIETLERHTKYESNTDEQMDAPKWARRHGDE